MTAVVGEHVHVTEHAAEHRGFANGRFALLYLDVNRELTDEETEAVRSEIDDAVRGNANRQPAVERRHEDAVLATEVAHAQLAVDVLDARVKPRNQRVLEAVVVQRVSTDSNR